MTSDTLNSLVMQGCAVMLGCIVFMVVLFTVSVTILFLRWLKGKL